ncbi:MAG: Uma2 family endonuclease [Isosphaeraceae bacterium]|nr:Uma2 family endonuclease [Isosphaeraceae bacterium]
MADAASSPLPLRMPTHLDLPDRFSPESEARVHKTFRMPTHLDLPEKDDSCIVSNFREHPQSYLLTESILPVLRRRHPDEHFAIGQDSLIYYRLTDPTGRGCKAPDWYYVPGVPPQFEGHFRRSYVMWQELISPEILLEFVSGDGSEERDRTPWQGKFWIYEQVLHATYYGLFEVESGHLEVYHLVDGRYERIEPDDRGHFPIETLGISLGVWHGHVLNEEAPWMRWFDANGAVLPTSEELLETERQVLEAERNRAEVAQQQAEVAQQQATAAQQQAAAERKRVALLAQRLRELGIDPDAL